MLTIIMTNAGFFRRLVTIIYDLFLLATIILLGTLVVLPLTHGQAISPNNHFYQIYLISLIISFYLSFWLYNGQTLGMLAWHLRLVSIDGKRITLRQGLLRIVLIFMNLICFGLGFFWMLLDKQKRTLYDCGSKTKVVYLPKGDGKNN